MTEKHTSCNNNIYREPLICITKPSPAGMCPGRTADPAPEAAGRNFSGCKGSEDQMGRKGDFIAQHPEFCVELIPELLFICNRVLPPRLQEVFCHTFVELMSNVEGARQMGYDQEGIFPCMKAEYLMRRRWSLTPETTHRR